MFYIFLEEIKKIIKKTLPFYQYFLFQLLKSDKNKLQQITLEFITKKKGCLYGQPHWSFDIYSNLLSLF